MAIDDFLNRESRHDVDYLLPFSRSSRSLKLTISNPGFLEILCFIDDENAVSELADDGIEIDIKAPGLDFKDVILALGQLACNHLGHECSGVVTRVGKAITNIRLGDHVCSVTESSIANRERCKAACSTPIPGSRSYLEGASFPIVYYAAQYCLSNVARLQPGEIIMIHAAAGGVGQAAIMLAQAIDAKILATVGSLEKKKLLMEMYNIPEECISYSRDISFTQGVMDATAGEGVDVALKSLAGEQLRATWECMAPFGRFVEIGKRDITSNQNLEMSRFERNVSFTAVDLTDLVSHRQNVLQQLLVDVIDMIKRGIIRPVSPIHKFGVSEVETAFRSLQSGKLMGKMVIVPEEDEMVMVGYRLLSECCVLKRLCSALLCWTALTVKSGHTPCVRTQHILSRWSPYHRRDRWHWPRYMSLDGSSGSTKYYPGVQDRPGPTRNTTYDREPEFAEDQN